MSGVLLIAKSVLIEAVRRREIYAIVLLSTLLIGAVMAVDFFKLEGLTKFYREIALKIMSVATAVTVVVLAARQLPREFEKRTIYPLLARPVTRAGFLLGKLLGVMGAATFCFVLFMGVYVLGTHYLKGEIPWMLFLQYIYLQLLMMLILATLSFWLSMVLNLDAAITIGVLFYAFAATFTSATTFIYHEMDAIGQRIVVALTWIIPQLTLLDLSDKAVHAEFWDAVPAGVIAQVTIYGLIYVLIYFAMAWFTFRRKAL